MTKTVLRHLRLALVAAASLTACDRVSGGRSNIVAAAASQAPEHVDSAIPRAEALRRFRVGLTEVSALTGGAPTREELVRRFVLALEHRDTAVLRDLAVTRAEFAYLYYPTDPQGLPPYDLSPGLMWFMLEGRSAKGLGHALAERGGRPLGYLNSRCLGASTVEGRNTLWGPCVVRRVQSVGDTVEERLFGQVLGRDGRFKFLSYSNKID